jgi:hypothetical protein
LRYLAVPLTVSLGLIAAGCAKPSGGEVLKLAPQAHPLVDNLYVAGRPGGDLAPLGGGVGSFALRGRCLELLIGGQRRTPVFTGRTGIERDGLVVRDRKIRFGAEVRLGGLDSPFRLAEAPNPDCPAEAVLVRSIGD